MTPAQPNTLPPLAKVDGPGRAHDPQPAGRECHELVAHARTRAAQPRGVQQTVAVLGKDRRNPYGFFNAGPDEPAKQPVILHLPHQLPLGPDRERDLEQAGADQALRRDRGATKVDVEPVEFSAEAGRRLVDHLPDLAQRMTRRDPVLKIDVAEQRQASSPPHRCASGESCSRTRAEP